MNKLFTLLLLFSICNLFGQERLSNFEGGLVSQSAEYIGQYDGHLYYYDTRQERTNVFRENLQDGILESELILSIDDEEFFILDRILLTGNKLVFEEINKWQIYDLDNQEFLEFELPNNDLSDAVYALGHGFMLFSDSILQVDLSDGSLTTHPKGSSFEEEFPFNDELNNVLVDSFAIVIEIDQSTDEQHFLSLNVFTGATEILQTFTTYDFYFYPIFDKGGFHLQVVNTLDETHKLYSFISKKGGIEFKVGELEIPADLAIEKVNEKYCFATESDFSTGENIKTIYLQDFESMEFKTMEVTTNSDFRDVEITNEGVYFHKDDNEFGLLNFEGESTVFIENVNDFNLSSSEYSSAQSYIDDEFLLISFRFNGFGIKSSLVNEDGVVFLNEHFVREIIYDEVLDENFAYLDTGADRQQISVVVNQELKQLHKNELEIKEGGSFRILDEATKILRGSGDEGGNSIYRLDANYKELVTEERIYSNRSFTINNELYFITKEGDENYLNQVDFESDAIDETIMNLNGNSALTSFEVYGGSDFSIISYGDFTGFKFAALTPDGDFQPIVDPNTGNTYILTFYSDPKTINGKVVSLVENSATGTADLVMFGKTYEETKVLVEDVDPFDAYLDDFIEGENWSFVEFSTPFLLKNDGTLLDVDFEEPYYSNGNFYFSDKIFSEEQELITDWNSDLSEIAFVNNGLAYDNKGNSVEVVNIASLEKTELDFGSAFFVQFYDADGKTAVVNVNSDKVLFTDGTEAGTTTLDATYPFSSSRNVQIIGSTLVYSAFDSGFGNELVAFNLETSEEKVFDINPGNYSSNPSLLFTSDTDVYLIAFEQDSGEQLYRLTADMILDVVSLDEKSIELDVFPNPTADFISVDEEIDYEQVAIFSVDGSLMKVVNRSNLIDVVDLNQGTYFVKILDNGRIVGTSKFVKI